MNVQQKLLDEIRHEQCKRMENIKRYYPFFQIISNNLEQYKNGKYKTVDMGYTVMAVLRMMIEENNFNDTGVTYQFYHDFMVRFLEKEFHMQLSQGEYSEIIGYIFDKIKNDGKPFAYLYYDPIEGVDKTARVWLVKNHFIDNSIYYYITDIGIEFYLNTKEFEDESKISVQQLLLEKMIKTQNFKGGREVVKRICNEVNKLKMEKREVLHRLSNDLKIGMELYQRFFKNSVCWFHEEQDLFQKNTKLIATAFSMLSPLEQIKNKEDIFLLDGELQKAVAMHSKLLSECMDLKIKADSMVEQGKLNSIRSVFRFRQVVDSMMETDDVGGLAMIATPLFQPHIRKSFNLKRIDTMLDLKLGTEDEAEQLEHVEEEGYIYDDELEDARISYNYIKLMERMFDMLWEHEVFTLKEWNLVLEKKFGSKLFVNGDYYSYLVNLCLKREYIVETSANNPQTNFEAMMKAYLIDKPDDKGWDMGFRICTIPEETLTISAVFAVFNIRFERIPKL